MTSGYICNGKHVLIMGLGRFGGGVGAVRFFCEQGARVTITDIESASELAESLEQIRDCDVQLHMEGHREDDFVRADIVCVSPAVRPGNRFVEAARVNGADIVTEMGLFFSLFPGRIIGITGTNGKSTTAFLTASMLEPRGNVYLGGNIGISLLTSVKTFTENDTAVLELSSFQLCRLDTCGRSPETAVITNISPNHLDWHAGPDEYIRCKSIITKYQKQDDTVLFCAEDKQAEKAARRSAGMCVSVGLQQTGNGICLLDDTVISVIGGKKTVLFCSEDVKLKGRFNLLNAMCAAGAAYTEGASPEDIRSALHSFRGLPHRLEFVCETNGIEFYNDSVSTTPESTAAAAGVLSGNSVFILGGYDKGIDLRPAVDAVVVHCTGAVCIGDTGPDIASLVSRTCKSGFSLEQASSLEEAVRKATAMLRGRTQGRIVLSPACASYDMFDNFEQRGEVFRNLARKEKR